MASSNIKELVLYSFSHSSASWRVRAVLALKKIPFKYRSIHLLKGENHSEYYLKKNPMHQLPTLVVNLKDGSSHTLIQSLAIIRFLDDNYPEPSIYPKDSWSRYKSIAIADTISSGIQPLQNIGTLDKYTEPLSLPPLDQSGRRKVAQFWLGKLADLERLVSTTAGMYCVGDEVSIADVCLVPQIFNAKTIHQVDLGKYPLLKAIDERLQSLKMFKDSHPMSCPEVHKPM